MGFASSGPFLPFDFSAQPLFLRAQLRREFLTERVSLENGTDLQLTFLLVRVGATPRPFERFLHRLHLPDPEAGDQLPGLREGPVDDGALLAREAHTLVFCARMKTVPG